MHNIVFSRGRAPNNLVINYTRVQEIVNISCIKFPRNKHYGGNYIPSHLSVRK